MNQIKLKIITPEKVFFNDMADIVLVKTKNVGYIGLQHGRPPFLASLDIAILQINSKQSPNFKTAAISGGIVVCENNVIEIITDDITFKENINLDMELRKSKKLEEELKLKNDNARNMKIELELQRSINKINLKKS